MTSASDLASWYKNPPTGSLVLLDGCGSAGPYANSPLFNAFSKAGTVAGYRDEVTITWNSDSVSELFKQMSEKGSSIGGAENYVWNTYKPSWEAAHGHSYYNQQLVFSGDTAWKLK